MVQLRRRCVAANAHASIIYAAAAMQPRHRAVLPITAAAAAAAVKPAAAIR